MLEISTTDDWRREHPGACIGLLELSGIENHPASPELERRKREIEGRLRERYAGWTRPQLLALPVMHAYEQYYRRFQKTYHVLLQLESLVLKGKSLPNVSPLVDANFMSELETLVLTAGHDAQKLQGPIRMDSARPGDQMTQMGGALKSIPPGDMLMRDEKGVCCSILYGQDDRSPISPKTSHALYVAYAPTGVGEVAVQAQLQGIEEIVRLFCPEAVLEQSRLLLA